MTQFHKKVGIPSGTIEVDIWVSDPFNLGPNERAIVFQVIDAVKNAAQDWDILADGAEELE